ncbi:sulfite exporter TauE/SafE family protein [Devosia sp.]|uniref:sulfite exporter TauE/SafE family protein n=1 Tax=Devosia sp. TaxID=1871048 RepID=UPI002F1F485B
MTELLLLVAGLVGGALNSLAGGGSFVVFPALLAAGVPPVLANASNTFAALPGYASGAAGFWADIMKHRERLLLYSAMSLVFGYLGAELLLHVSDAQFELAVPWLMLFAVVLFAFGAQLNQWVQTRASGSQRLRATGAVLLLGLLAASCVYGGFFNAGLGILLLAFLALAGFTDIHAMNGIKLWISFIIALVAVVRFALGDSIDWYHGSIALVGVTIGGYLAARLAHLIPARLIRALVIVYGVGLTGYFFWDAYAG